MGWQSSLQNYISLPLHTSVSGISKRHAHKVYIKCPVSKLRLRLQTVETGHYFCSPMPLRTAKKPRQIPWAKIYNFCQGDRLIHGYFRALRRVFPILHKGCLILLFVFHTCARAQTIFQYSLQYRALPFLLLIH